MGYDITKNKTRSKDEEYNTGGSEKNNYDEGFWPSLEILENNLLGVVELMDEFEKDVENCENTLINSTKINFKKEARNPQSQKVNTTIHGYMEYDFFF